MLFQYDEGQEVKQKQQQQQRTKTNKKVRSKFIVFYP
jgi:hypothetical protein